MPPKIILFVIFFCLFSSPAQTFAQPELNRQALVSASLDAVEQRLAEQAPVVSAATNYPSIFSDFIVTSPIIDLLSLYKAFTSPILCFDGEGIPDLPEDFSLDSAPLEEDLGSAASEEDLGSLPLFSDWDSLVQLFLGAHYGYFAGHTNYEISFDSGKSELEFPLTSWSVIGAKLTATFPKINLVSESVGYISTHDRSGTMYDTDWDATETIISDTTSKAYLKLLIWDSSLGYMFWRNFDPGYSNNEWDVSITALGGYKHEYLRCKIYDVYDTSGTITAYTGPALNYTVRYNIPYLGLKFNLAKPPANWGMSIKACFSPFVLAKDLDDHLLRGKRSDGECNGWAALVGANLFYHLNDAWTLQGGIDYANIRTAGEQVQHWYLAEGSTPAGTTIGGIDMNIYSNQLYYWGRVNFKF